MDTKMNTVTFCDDNAFLVISKIGQIEVSDLKNPKLLY